MSHKVWSYPQVCPLQLFLQDIQQSQIRFVIRGDRRKIFRKRIIQKILIQKYFSAILDRSMFFQIVRVVGRLLQFVSEVTQENIFYFNLQLLGKMVVYSVSKTHSLLSGEQFIEDNAHDHLYGSTCFCSQNDVGPRNCLDDGSAFEIRGSVGPLAL